MTSKKNVLIAVAVSFVLVIGGLFGAFVNLKPEITPNFFFASDSAIYKKNQQITDVFPSQQQILLNVSGQTSIEDPAFVEKIRVITEEITALKGVSDVQSLTQGPSSLEAAQENPLWQRILIGKEKKSSFIIAFIETDDFTGLVKEVEAIAATHASSKYKIHISGMPYVVEQIRRNLTQDMKTFTLGAVLLSTLVLFYFFRSFAVVIGAVIACMSAAMLTLSAQSLLGISIGILTANLGTIVFVLTLSHVIFLSSNWNNSAESTSDGRLKDTLGHTGKASLWAALTTLFGFVSLIFVEAKPLNELGIGGTIGTLAALLCAYFIFPAFLQFASTKSPQPNEKLNHFLPPKKRWMANASIAMTVAALILGSIGLIRLNTDPSLLSYFEKDTELYEGLYFVDDNGGSNPLLLVVRRSDSEKLDKGESYEQLWQLQNALAAHEEVGSVISLPVIMAEGNEHWLGQLLPWDWLLDILSDPDFGAIAKSFITEDRTHALFMLRMQESERERVRLDIVKEIQDIPAENGFELTLTGGTYYLQGELAASVARSMTTGVVALLVVFGIVAFTVSRSIPVTVSLVACASIIAALVLGTLGTLSIPVDIISSPAINICLGLIVDDMIHLTVTARRIAAQEKGRTLSDWGVWQQALKSQGRPAMISTVAIIIGFSVFALSDFPPSRRFGLEVAYGAGLAVVLALAVFPYFATQSKKLLSKVGK